VKARRVKGLDPAAPLGDNAEKIVRVRLDELTSFMPKAADPDEVVALHDMRIAAKRLRYVLEVTGPCFGPYARQAAKRMKELQDLLGAIHDCDVLVPRVEELLARTRDAAARPGLAALIAHHRERRAELFERFRAFFTELERAGFRARLEYAIRERPAGTTVATAP
jgi:CHAD domain-containing protein